MKFVAHNHYTNNSYVIGGMDGFNHAYMHFILTEMDVTPTQSGLTFFLLNKMFSLEEKIEFVRSLNQALQDKFGCGLSAVTSAQSDCLLKHEVQPFCDGVKGIDGDIKTIFVGDPRIMTPRVDCQLKGDLHLAKGLLAFLQPTEGDKQEPAEGWEKFETELFKIYAETVWALEDRMGQLSSFRPMFEDRKYMRPVDAFAKRNRFKPAMPKT